MRPVGVSPKGAKDATIAVCLHKSATVAAARPASVPAKHGDRDDCLEAPERRLRTAKRTGPDEGYGSCGRANTTAQNGPATKGIACAGKAASGRRRAGPAAPAWRGWPCRVSGHRAQDRRPPFGTRARPPMARVRSLLRRDRCARWRNPPHQGGCAIRLYRCVVGRCLPARVTSGTSAWTVGSPRGGGRVLQAGRV